jgi:hypothetical protein
VRRIGLDESFFKLGGHSLIAVQVFSEIERSIGERLPLSTLFRAPRSGCWRTCSARADSSTSADG